MYKGPMDKAKGGYIEGGARGRGWGKMETTVLEKQLNFFLKKRDSKE